MARAVALLWAILLGALAPLAGHLSAGETYLGQVQRVVDGDTVQLLTSDYEQIRVRLYGIDAPERSQDGGPQSQAALRGLIEGRQVTVEVLDVDRYGRLVGLIFLDGLSVNLEMVERGQAWVYDSYCKDKEACQGLSAAQGRAREARLGLWADASPVPPWDYRRRARSGGSPGGLDVHSGSGGSSGQAAGRPAIGAASRFASTALRGNRKSKVFHNPGCRHYDCPNCVESFKSREEALSRGYRACRICGG
jgi:endonuclease YncB( thermonuclease family)